MDSPISIFHINSTPYGLTYGEWSAVWWKWLLSIPKSKNPAFDLTGANININQTQPNLLFLCQTVEGVESVPIRKGTIIEGRAVFMPIINWLSRMHIDGENDQELLAVAQKRMDVVTNLEVIINGVKIKERLKQYRAQSPFFDLVIPEHNIFNLPAGRRRFVSDGYWILFRPLQKNLNLSSFGSCSSGITKIRVEYRLTQVE